MSAEEILEEGLSLADQGIARLSNRARWALSLLFLVDGLTFGTWAALIPSFQEKFHLSAETLSWVLLGMISGALVSMPLTGRLIGHYGSDRMARIAALGFPVTLIGIALAPGFGWLIVAAIGFGVWKGMLDVSVNAQAITVENAMERPVMGGFQGCWSLGGVSASALLSALMHHGCVPEMLMVGMGIGLVAVGFFLPGKLLCDRVKLRSDRGNMTSKPNYIWCLGGLSFVALFSEGVMLDWSAVYARVVGGMSLATAPLGFATFAFCMAGGRFLGDFIVTKLGPLRVLQLSGVLLAGGVAVAMIGAPWPLILTGFALVGTGTSNIVPILFGVAGRLKAGHAGAHIAAVTTMGYLGFLAGPPLIGFIAAWLGLPRAFALVVISGILIATVGVAVIRQAGRQLTESWKP